jgi:hypothetical protein
MRNIWLVTVGGIALGLGACHGWRGGNNAKPMTATEMCNECCQQQADACKMDSDHPGYYCPHEQQACVTACGAGDENQMCVVDTNKRMAKSAPKPLAPAPMQASNAPVAATHRVVAEQRGECDNRGTWKLKIADAHGRGSGCSSLGEVPRDVSFRIERQKELYALRDLVPTPGWQDGFAVENHDDVCIVTLTRSNHDELEHPKLMRVQLSEKNGVVSGSFHYLEEMKQPIDCRLDAVVSGEVEALAPRPAPPMVTQPPQPLPQRPPSAPAMGGSQALQPQRPVTR